MSALFGSPRGRYRTIELQGEEANQGPYFLAAGESGVNLFIVAGSERVSVDGETMTRGQDRDYVIDYVRGTVTFTYRRLITSESLIVVEYEEGEGPYARSVVGGGVGGQLQLGGLPVALQARITREEDDTGRLRSGELDPDDEAVLAAAGDDPLQAVAPGATPVDPGQGQYIQVGSGDDEHFEFASEGGDWTLEFFYAGAGLGDYDLSNLTESGLRVYTWVGDGRGSYRVGRELPLPGSQSLVTLVADVGDTSQARLHAEWHLSRSDLNVLSDRDDGDNTGAAGQLALSSGDLGLAGGRLQLHGALEDRGDRFAPFTVAKTIHDFEGWGLGSRARRAGFLEQRDRELSGGLSWRTGQGRDLAAVALDAGRLEHGADLTADRTTARGNWSWRGGHGRHLWRQAESRDGQDPLEIQRRDQQHDLRWQLGAGGAAGRLPPAALARRRAGRRRGSRLSPGGDHRRPGVGAWSGVDLGRAVHPRHRRLPAPGELGA